MSFSIESVYNWYRNTIRNPKYRWWIILGTALYLLSPFDIAPDFLPIVGQIDDVALVTLLISEVSQILIDYLKKRQNKSVVSGEPQPPDASNTTARTIDVEASTLP
ncbi:MAG: YkvA family protein [Oscillatoriaceae bacterium SKW80]|nr:YkvA family protein [Oscillatoriaceae bacterium SKYG93]MCX8119816.1 YkvA family protein [Oscillatoriaceae bacterium SKW80]MDW8452080.1 YkvA family protein [Oscillatoriaceae cyanobacterium SKYGB_i_bin93]HIK27483.1 DUF1232 domain-containing protein [Oscillatoriaceae cyanobacterium M7585_C2015_266]